jgi:hypothetical protein
MNAPRVLRFVGGSMLVASAATFMVHRWGAGDDIVRYMWLMGLTTVVAAAGWFCGLRLDDSRGARTLLGLVLAVTPVHFAVLGGLVYSQFALDPVALSPTRALWDAPSPLAALTVVGIGLVTLFGMCWMSMRVFVQNHATKLSAAFMLTNAFVLIPVREPSGVAIVLAVATLLVTHLQRGVFADHGPLATGEGRAARALLAAPLLILVGRTLHLYDPTTVFAAVFGICATYVAFVWIPRLSGSEDSLRTLQTIAGLAFLPSIGLLSLELVKELHLRDAVAVLTFGVPLAIAWATLSLGALNPAPLRKAAVIVLASTALFALIADPDPVTAAMCILVGVALLAYGIQARVLGSTAMGAVTTFVGVAFELSRVIRVEALSNWMVLSALGITLVVGAALVERHAPAMQMRFARLRTELRSWET